jgi:hypothetical protein
VARKSTGDGAAVLKFAGPATIRQAADVWARLCEVAPAHKQIKLDLDEVTACDLIFVQLIESARRTWAAAGGEVRLSAPANPALRDVLDRGGFLDAEDAARLEFWTHETANQDPSIHAGTAQ